jgi:hypothetical protein
MPENLAFCGLDCSTCPACIATRANDDAAKQALAAQWSSADYKVTPADINCTGCQPDAGQKFAWCAACPTRLCAIEKGVANCAHCASYPCPKLDPVFARSPECKARLDTIRAQL